MGGIVGALLVGVFADPDLGGAGFGDGISSIGEQGGIQSNGIVATLAYSGVLTFIILKVLDLILGLLVSEDEEMEGLDLVLHDEAGYNL